eukprot:scaffold7167_cov62-Isochrysis_galbana.AAC.1
MRRKGHGCIHRPWSTPEVEADLTCGWRMAVISFLRNFLSYAAAMTSDETKLQSVMIVCVMVRGDTRKIMVGSPRMKEAGRAQPPKLAFCSLLRGSKPSGSSQGTGKPKRSWECSPPIHG